MTARLATDLWVSAYRARLAAANIPVVITARGDATAGSVVVKCATLDGAAQAWARSYDLMADTRVWRLMADGPEAEVDATLSRAKARDPDLWIIELEDRGGRTLLDQPGLSE
jgi:hypothetical protein